jgi:hypothetical protein
MRKLTLLPLLALVFACNESTLVQPEQSPEIAADRGEDGDAKDEYTFQFWWDCPRNLDNPLPQPTPTETEDGDLVITTSAAGWLAASIGGR